MNNPYSLAELDELLLVDGAGLVHVEALEAEPQDLVLSEHAIGGHHAHVLVELDRPRAVEV